VSRDNRKTLWLGAGVMIFIAAVQIWIVSAGTWIHWPRYSDDFSRLADGFLHGQLSLLVKPPPQLLALPDPYDSKANAPYRWHDASLYNGRYYLYWGPVPSLLAAIVCWPLRISTPDFGDQYLALIFTLGTVLLAAILIFQARAKLFPSLGARRTIGPILALGLGTPLLYDLARAAVYETAIIAGQFFLMAGLVAAWFALCAPKPRPALMALAGLSWALAVGSRISLPPAVGIITLLTLWQLRRHGKQAIPAMICLLAPLIAGAAALAWYNQARFGSVFETGLQYQLATASRRGISVVQQASPRYILPNLLLYTAQPPYSMHVFPYVMAMRTGKWIGAWFGLPSQYIPEPIVGLIWCGMFLLFAPVALWKSRKKDAQASPLRRWLIWSLAAGGILGFAPTLIICGGTLRYVADLIPCCMVLATLGYWRALEAAQSRPRWSREIRAIARLLMLSQCIVGLLLAINGMEGQFANFNPRLFSAMRAFFPSLRL
jgi:DNA-binding transcriptional regulator of glucitol operon